MFNGNYRTKPEGSGNLTSSSTEDQLRVYKRSIGCIAPDLDRGVEVATWLNISRFMEAVGDENPLFCDVNYGAASLHHTMLAPPAFVVAVCGPSSAGFTEQDDSQNLIGRMRSLSVTWTDVARLGDRLSGIPVVRAVGGYRNSRTADRLGWIRSEVEYKREGTVLAQCSAETALLPEKELVDCRDIQEYSHDEIAQMVYELDNEPEPRGRVPRFWSEIRIGEQSAPVLKGPLTLSDLIVWRVAQGRVILSGNIHQRRIEQLRGRRRENPITRWPIWDISEAGLDSAVTAPGGPESPGDLVFALMSQYAVNWMGDDAFLYHEEFTLSDTFRYGDVLRLSGEISDRYILSDEHGYKYYAAVLNISAINQLGTCVASAECRLFMPERGKPVKLPVSDILACDWEEER